MKILPSKQSKIVLFVVLLPFLFLFGSVYLHDSAEKRLLETAIEDATSIIDSADPAAATLLCSSRNTMSFLGSGAGTMYIAHYLINSSPSYSPIFETISKQGFIPENRFKDDTSGTGGRFIKVVSKDSREPYLEISITTATKIYREYGCEQEDSPLNSEFTIPTNKAVVKIQYGFK